MCSPIAGNATFATVESSITMNCAIPTIARIFHRAGWLPSSTGLDSSWVLNWDIVHLHFYACA